MKITKHLTGLIAVLFATSALAVPVVLDITTDDFGGETLFAIFDSFDPDLGGNIFDGYAYDTDASSFVGNNDGYVEAGELDSNTSYTFVWDLAPGDYAFVIGDTFGDGICCDFGEGSFMLTVDGTETFSGGEFGGLAPINDQGEWDGNFTASAAAVSEPGTLALLGLGVIGLAIARRRA